jgi:hypothetical protein
MMHHARDNIDAQLAQPMKARIMPGPVLFLEAVGRDAFPKHGTAQGAGAECRDAVEVLQSIGMAGFRDLVPPCIADTNNGGFNPAPDFERMAL